MGSSKHDKTHNTDSFYGQPVKNCSDDSWCVFQPPQNLANSRFEIADPRKILRGSESWLQGCSAARAGGIPPVHGPASSNHESIDNGDTFDRQTTGIGQSTPDVILNLPKLAEIQNP